MRPLACLVLAALIGGCRFPGPVADRSAFFDLTPTVSPDGRPSSSWDVSVGLGPVAIPSYLDRPQLVRRVGANELRLAAVARWAEPLREGIVRTLRHDVFVASGARTVTPYPWSPSAAPDLAVVVDVLRFEPTEQGVADLFARWSVREVAHRRVLVARESRIAEPIEGSGPAAEVAALSRALGGLGREIATALREAKPGS